MTTMFVIKARQLSNQALNLIEITWESLKYFDNKLKLSFSVPIFNYEVTRLTMCASPATLLNINFGIHKPLITT